MSDQQGSVDWDELRRAAVAASASAYAPYSGLHVGVAAVADDGRLLTGCNVENASYGLALCAECGLVSSLVASGGGRLIALACRSGAGELLMPCGRCRQLLWENGGPELRLWTGTDGETTAETTMQDLLPHAFDASELDRGER